MSIFNNTPKILRWPKRIAAYRDGKPFAPVTMELDLTNRCNLNCPHCQDAGLDRSLELPTKAAMNWLTQLRDYGVEGVLFSGGGEPLMHPDAVAIVEHAHALGLRCAMVTNGMVSLCGGRSAGLCHADRLAAVCQWIRVSVDGTEGAWDTISLLAAAPSRKSTVGVAYLVNAETKQGMARATDSACESGCDYIQFRPYHNDFTPIDDVLPMLRQYVTEGFNVLCSEQ